MSPIETASATDRIGSRILVIIPAYNESECILATVRNIEAYGYDYIVVNDGSKDDTLSICRANALNVLDLPQNLGIGGAVQAGHKYAQRHGYDIDIQVDGDGQHDPSYIPKLVEQINNGADLAVGSRFLEKTDGFQSTFMRRVGITWLSWWIKLFTGETVTDPTSGFRACDRKAIDLFCKNYPDDYPEPESLALAMKTGLSVREASVKMLERQGGQSSIGGFSSVYYMIKVSLAVWIVCWIHRKGV
ncbi:glycosyltransferase family 2 protein [Parolsenella catena]|uniref:glycosyltransferase family 2 protein n=1 Tax=Parolsenella catena TaxID=2003188 RepID=UPI003A8DE5AF